MQNEIALLIGREIAAAMNENRETVQRVMGAHLKSIGETASADKFTVRNLNADQVIIEGESVTEQAATYLRGAGFDVLHSGNVLVAKSNNANKRKLQSRGGADTRVGELKFFNDDKSIRDARKMYQTLVEAKDWRFFPQFLKDLDNVIVNARMREGHDVDSDPDDGSTAENTEQKHAPMLKNDAKDRAVAAADGPTGDKGGPGDPGVKVEDEPEATSTAA